MKSAEQEMQDLLNTALAQKQPKTEIELASLIATTGFLMLGNRLDRIIELMKVHNDQAENDA